MKRNDKKETISIVLRGSLNPDFSVSVVTEEKNKVVGCLVCNIRQLEIYKQCTNVQGEEKQ